MAVLTEAGWVLLNAWRVRYDRFAPVAGTPQQTRELAGTMRRLPGRYADRLPPRVIQRVSGAAGAGQWERAVDRLVTALSVRRRPVTADERDELRTLLRALNLPAERADALPACP